MKPKGIKYVLYAYDDIERASLRHIIEFDAFLGMSENYTNQVAAFTVDGGAIVHDHVIKNKDKVSIDGVITDLTFFGYGGDDGLITITPSGAFSFVTDNTRLGMSIEAKNKLLEI